MALEMNLTLASGVILTTACLETHPITLSKDGTGSWQATANMELWKDTAARDDPTMAQILLYENDPIQESYTTGVDITLNIVTQLETYLLTLPEFAGAVVV